MYTIGEEIYKVSLESRYFDQFHVLISNYYTVTAGYAECGAPKL